MTNTPSIFVSFCLEDYPTEEPSQFSRDNWIEGFIKTLHYLFVQSTDFKELEIVNSRSVDSPEKAKKYIDKSDIFLVVYSTNYCYQSQSFDELKYFEKQKDASEETIIIFPELIQEQDIPFYLKKYIFYHFFYEDREIDLVIKYHSNDKSVFGEYINMLRDLICDIQILIDKKTDNYYSNGKIYLAITSFDMVREYQQIRRLIISAKYEVLPKVNIPLRNSAIKELVISYLSECSLSIHIVGSYFGGTLSHSKQSIVSMQILLTEQFCKKDQLTTLVWYPFHITAKETRQQAFLEFLGMILSGKKNTTLMRSNIEELKTKIKSILFEEENRGFEIESIYPERSTMIIFKGKKYIPLSKMLRRAFIKELYHTYCFQMDNVVMTSWENVCYRIFHCRILIVIAETDREVWIQGLMNLVKKRVALRRKKNLGAGKKILILESIFSKELLEIKGFDYTLFTPGQEANINHMVLKKVQEFETTE